MTEELARAESPRGEVVLRRHETGVIELRVNGVFVMDTAETTTERRLASEALGLVANPRRVLIGGLGLGFTALEVLADPRVRQVSVVEIEDAVVEWLREGSVPHGPALLADPRLEVVLGDVADHLRGAGTAYDVVLLDVDNGPGYLVYDTNAAIYGRVFLDAARRRLAPGGMLIVWSAAAAPVLADTMRQVFGRCTEHEYAVDLQGREEAYYLYASSNHAR